MMSALFSWISALSNLGIYWQMAMRVIAIFAFIEKPAVRPDPGGPQDLLAGPEDDPHRLVVEYHRKACHAREPSNNLAAGSSGYVPTCQRVTVMGSDVRVILTRATLCQLDAAA